jgi:hypothetical protein
MTRVLAAVCVMLLTVSVLEALALRSLKQQLASADERATRAALLDLGARRDEVLRVLAWLDATERNGPGAAHANGLCKDGALDLQAIGSRVFDAYLLERARGRTEIEARQATLDAIARTSR